MVARDELVRQDAVRTLSILRSWREAFFRPSSASSSRGICQRGLLSLAAAKRVIAFQIGQEASAGISHRLQGKG